LYCPNPNKVKSLQAEKPGEFLDVWNTRSHLQAQGRGLQWVSEGTPSMKGCDGIYHTCVSINNSCILICPWGFFEFSMENFHIFKWNLDPSLSSLYLAIHNAVLLDQRRLSAASEKSYSLARL
jgi:hypothetical protein